jgi:hypothetical protein
MPNLRSWLKMTLEDEESASGRNQHICDAFERVREVEVEVDEK